jgi:putative transposase
MGRSSRPGRSIEWAYRRGVALDFIRPGKPAENGHLESFNGRFRHECLNANQFLSIEDAKSKIEPWRNDYNMVRPHGSWGHLTPNEYIAKGREPRTMKAGCSGSEWR